MYVDLVKVNDFLIKHGKEPIVENMTTRDYVKEVMEWMIDIIEKSEA